MFKTKPFPFSLLVLVVLLVLHILSSYLSWYWSHPWIGYFVHILGGLWIASVFLWLAAYLNQISSMIEYKTKSLLIALISAALFGVLWEIVENFTHITFINDISYGFNTAVDLLNDVIGGLLAYAYFIKRRSNRKITHQPIMVDDVDSVYNKIGLVNHDTVDDKI